MLKSKPLDRIDRMNYLYFIYTKHAKERMSERGLTIKQVETAVRAPSSISTSFGGRQIARRKYRNRIAEVVFTKASGRIVIITAYWVEGEIE